MSNKTGKGTIKNLINSKEPTLEDMCKTVLEFLNDSAKPSTVPLRKVPELQEDMKQSHRQQETLTLHIFLLCKNKCGLQQLNM